MIKAKVAVIRALRIALAVGLLGALTLARAATTTTSTGTGTPTLPAQSGCCGQ